MVSVVSFSCNTCLPRPLSLCVELERKRIFYHVHIAVFYCNNRINNMTQLEPLESPTVAQRLRRASTSVTGVVMNYNPQPGMWAATGTAIAYAPTLEELRRPVNGGQNIVYNAHGHGARSTPSANPDYSAVTTTETKTSAVLERTETFIESPASVDGPDTSP